MARALRPNPLELSATSLSCAHPKGPLQVLLPYDCAVRVERVWAREWLAWTWSLCQPSAQWSGSRLLSLQRRHICTFF